MKIRNVALQAKLKSARHNGAQAALKVVLQCALALKKAIER